jgi:hypothetical protein
MSTAPTIEREPDTTERRSLRWLWWSVLVLVLAGVGVALWLLLAADTQASITYDGVEAVYSGPSELEAYPNLQSFRLVNNSDNSVDFAYAPVKADALADITKEEASAWGLTHTDAPPWVGNGDHLAMLVGSGDIIEVDATFIAGRTYEFVVWDRAQTEAHWVAWIEASE